MPRSPGTGLRFVLVSCVIAAAAPGPAGEVPWAFARPRPAPPPPVRDTAWVRTPVDRFVLAKLEAANLRPTPEPDRVTLLKRVTHDLTGLAPTPEESAAFLADPSPAAYEKVVDRLLQSPRFGERWAQHWLELVRYSESEGFKLDRERPDAWRYRDYVIRAFNDDLPFDRFLRQQLAGDELEPGNPAAVVATGFLRVHPEESNGADYRQIRQDILNDVTDTFGSVVLGLTVQCARCHNHKADPITQQDYYNLQAFFAPMYQRDDAVLLPPAEEAAYRAKLEAWQAATRPVREQLDRLLRPHREAMFAEVVDALDADTQKALRTPEPQRTAVQRQLAKLGGKQVTRRTDRAYRRLDGDQRKKYDDLVAKLAEFDRLKPAPVPTAMAVTDVGPDPPPTFRLAGGDVGRPKDPAVLRFPSAFGDPDPVVKPPADRPESTGRRAALAAWATGPANPLTGRVVVNRLWHHYFGRGIVATPSDFGEYGEAPTHPELLDWLAAELVREKWSLKAVHRLIVTSATYRQGSIPDRNPTVRAATKADPNNRVLWHMAVKRRDGESVRDVSLQVAGVLNLRAGGRSSRPELPAAVAESRYAWTPDADPAERNRRSVYTYHKRNLIPPLFKAFDAPSRNESCPARATTVTAEQSLAMLNSEFALDAARRTAGVILKGSGDRPAVVTAAYRRVYGRDPTRPELADGVAFLSEQSRTLGREKLTDATLPDPKPALPAADAAAVVDLVHALMNAAEFLYIE